MTAPLLSWPAPPPLAPPDASPLLASTLLAIALARSSAQLADWWRENQPALKRLGARELATAVLAKDAAKQNL